MDTKPSTYYHPLPVKLSNGFIRALNFPGLARISLTEEALLARARKETGLDRLGENAFLPGMRALLESLEKEGHLNPFGRFVARTRITASLKNRLWANACFEAHPEIRQRETGAPLIVVGLHRSGTTRMQRMLATDSRLQHLKTWEGINPAPRLDWPELGRTARRAEVRHALQKMQRSYPGAFTAHPMDADWPEEDLLLLNHSFSGFSPLGLYHVPSYYRWFLDADKTAAYRYMADLMKLISWARDDREDKRWLLKNPQHMLDLPTLLKTFPDAKLVFIHRDPIKTVGSALSLMWRFAVQHTDMPCRAHIRDTWLDFYERMAHRCIAARAHIPVAQQLDVHYADMNRDWRATMRRVYEFAEMEFTAEAENAMAAWLADSEREGLHGGHRYTLEDFGTTAGEVDARMKFYRERYKIPYESE